VDKKLSGDPDSLNYLCIAEQFPNCQYIFMLILLDCRPLQNAGPASEKSRLILSVAAILARDKVAEWLLLVDHTYQPGMLPELPEGRLISLRALPGRPGWKLWYDWQLPRLVKKHKPALIMLSGGVAIAPGLSPQCLWMPESANPKEIRPGRNTIPFYASRLMNSLHHAEMIFCFSEKDKTWLNGRGNKDKEHIIVVHPSPDETITPLSLGEKDRIKSDYTQGKEYFFTDARSAEEEDIIHLLKAFSLFKRRQMSNLQLVLAGTPAPGLQLKLETFKYRQDVHWVNPSSGNILMAAAYAALFPFGDVSLGTPLLNAWKAGIPALVAKDSRLHEMAGDAVLAAGTDDSVAFAGYMMSVYKDEMLRSELIRKGFSRLTAFDPSQTLAVIRTALGKMSGCSIQ